MSEKKTLAQYGLSPERAARMHREHVVAERATLDTSGRPAVKVLENCEILHSPNSDGERVWIGRRLSPGVANESGFEYEIVALSDGYLPDTRVITVLGKTNADGLFVEGK